MDQKILALHGWGSTGEGSATIGHIKKEFPNVIAPTYDYLNPAKTANQLLELAQEDYLFIMGISFGGFWARWLANQLKSSSLLMINPALDAYASTEKYIGLRENYVTHIPEFFVQKKREQLRQYEIEKDYINLPITAIVATDDDLVCPTVVEEYIGGDRCDLRYITGGHRVTDVEQWMPILKSAYHNLHF